MENSRLLTKNLFPSCWPGKVSCLAWKLILHVFRAFGWWTYQMQVISQKTAPFQEKTVCLFIISVDWKVSIYFSDFYIFLKKDLLIEKNHLALYIFFHGQQIFSIKWILAFYHKYPVRWLFLPQPQINVIGIEETIEKKGRSKQCKSCQILLLKSSIC